MVRGGQQQAGAAVRLDHLQEGVDDALELTVLLGVVAVAADGVEFVEDHDELAGAGVVDHPAQVRGGLAQIRRDQRVQPDHDQR